MLELEPLVLELLELDPQPARTADAAARPLMAAKFLLVMFIFLPFLWVIRLFCAEILTRCSFKRPKRPRSETLGRMI